MTAEVSILNRFGIALAADSAVTIQGSQGSSQKKIYNTVNKLFSLSKYHPIAIMIYDNSMIMGTPWETIIKRYRKRLGNRHFDLVDDYANDFIQYLSEFFSHSEKLTYLKTMVFDCVNFLHTTAIEALKAKYPNTTAPQDKYMAIFVAEVERYITFWSEQRVTVPLDGPEAVNLRDRCTTETKSLLGSIAEGYQYSEVVITKLVAAISAWIYSGIFIYKTGVVIAGFGELENFPSLVSYDIDGFAGPVMRHSKRIKYSIDTNNNIAELFPFAQRNECDTFTFGIDPNMENAIKSGLNSIFIGDYPIKSVDVVNSVIALTPEQRQEIQLKLSELGQGSIRGFSEKHNDYKAINHVRPIAAAIAHLPLGEMAAMAEILVNLALIKKRFTMESETVGGPIDVAVISKGDGLIWIKRKHYFDAALNPNYIKTYLQR